MKDGRDSSTSLSCPILQYLPPLPRSVETSSFDGKENQNQNVSWPSKPLFLTDGLHSGVTSKVEKLPLPINEVEGTEFETDLFKGKFWCHVIGLKSNQNPSTETFFKGRQRQVRFVICGKFKKTLNLQNIYSGQEFDQKSCVNLPPKWFVTAGMFALKRLAPAIKYDVEEETERKYLMTPLVSAAQTISVDRFDSEEAENHYYHHSMQFLPIKDPIQENHDLLHPKLSTGTNRESTSNPNLNLSDSELNAVIEASKEKEKEISNKDLSDRKAENADLKCDEQSKIKGKAHTPLSFFGGRRSIFSSQVDKPESLSNNTSGVSGNDGGFFTTAPMVKRKRFFNNVNNLNGEFNTRDMYTFEIYQHMMLLSTWDVKVGFAQMDMSGIIGYLPIQFMAKDMVSGEYLWKFDLYHEKSIKFALNNPQMCSLPPEMEEDQRRESKKSDIQILHSDDLNEKQIPPFSSPSHNSKTIK